MSTRPTPAENHRFHRKGISFDRAIRYFFASNAGLTIVILVLIIAFLLKEGLGFFPGYRKELETYRIAGLEYIDLSRKNLTQHEQLSTALNAAYYAEINQSIAKELKRFEEANAIFNTYNELTNPTRELLLKQLSQNAQSESDLIKKLRSNYQEQNHLALSRLPASPHLSPSERSSLILDLQNRALDASDDPPLISQISNDYALANQKAAEPLAAFRASIDLFDSLSSELSSSITELSQIATTTKSKIQTAEIVDNNRDSLLAAAKRAKTPEERIRLQAEAQSLTATHFDIEKPIQEILATKPNSIAIHQKLAREVEALLPQLPTALHSPKANRLLHAARDSWPAYLTQLKQTPEVLNAWDHTDPVPLTDALKSFLTGKEWITGGGWQDFYGILPLAIGSLMISFVALAIAIPTGIGAAIYISQFATTREQKWIKPIIEFIQAIPSVVLGFLGIMVLGSFLREISTLEALNWIPGFPIEERLNIFTAGCLLALMSIPTIFTLSEDALNNVPTSYIEAAEALGASRIQTTFRVMIPAAFSGILAASLLGLGRVIGETMVVLLVAGSRIKIPDFSVGIGAFFQPAHTLTGIIAQELGEVPAGSVHYRSLFVVGILLFAVVLLINATAHRFVNKLKH